MTKRRLAVVLSIPDEGGIAALLFREKKEDEWSYQLVTDSSDYFLERGQSHKTQVAKARHADSEKVARMEAQLARLGFPLDKTGGQGTFVGKKDLYPSSYDNADLRCSFVECVAVAFMHVNYDVMMSEGIPAITRSLAFEFLTIAVQAAKQLARQQK